MQRICRAIPYLQPYGHSVTMHRMTTDQRQILDTNRALMTEALDRLQTRIAAIDIIMSAPPGTPVLEMANRVIAELAERNATSRGTAA
jgi:hypothetical protein